MKWVNINNSSTKEIFELREDEKVLADISFSKQTRFVRIVSDLGRRMFSFEKKGFLHPYKVIRDEYGIKLGKVEEDKHGKGIVELDGKKYAFVYEENGSGDLIVYDEMMQKNLLRCNFKGIAGSLNRSTSLLDTKFASLLLLLCWYNFQPHNMETARLFSNSDLMLA
ncbi:MAG: hypothetical protein WAT20_09720 [Ferruginibacter sp.]|nr:hypothetical protein [Chitinophagaceae bacterium]